MRSLGRFMLVMLVAASCSSGIEAQDAVSKLRPFLEAHCLTCHDADTKEGGLDLTETAVWSLPEQIARWVRVHDRVDKGEMPPGEQKPKPEEKEAFLAELSQGLMQAHSAVKGTVLRRLNRLEYENTLHDLLGIGTPLAELLPEDGKSHGFDTVGAALDLSAAQLQKYLEAADVALTAATVKEPRPPFRKVSYHLDEGKNDKQLGRWWHKTSDGAVIVFNDGRFPPVVFDQLSPSYEGRYRIRLEGHAYQSNEPVTFGLYTVSRGRDSQIKLHNYYASLQTSLQPSRLWSICEGTEPSG